MQVPLSNWGRSVLQGVEGDCLRNARCAERAGSLLPYYHRWGERVLRIR